MYLIFRQTIRISPRNISSSRFEEHVEDVIHEIQYRLCTITLDENVFKELDPLKSTKRD
jgi:hypothetical protein